MRLIRDYYHVSGFQIERVVSFRKIALERVRGLPHVRSEKAYRFCISHRVTHDLSSVIGLLFRFCLCSADRVELFDSRERSIHRIQIKRLWIKLAANPFQQVLLLRITRVSDNLQEMLVAPNPTDVFRWACAFTRHTYRMFEQLSGLENLFH